MRTPTHSSPRPSKTAKKSRFKSIAGFTLAEVMIAFTVMVTGVAGSLTALTSSLQSIDNARCSSLAAQICQSQIERLRLFKWEDLSAKTTPTEGRAVTFNFHISDSNYSSISQRFQDTKEFISVHPTRSDMIVIKITTTWKDIKGVSHTRSMTTHYLKGGLYDCFKAPN